MATDPDSWHQATDTAPGPGEVVLLRLDGAAVAVGWRTAHRDEWVIRVAGDPPAAPGRTVHLHYSRVEWRSCRAAGAA